MCNKHAFNTEYLDVVIAPTLDCNFGCYYCFEGPNKFSKYMDRDIEDATISYIKKRNTKTHISWFGGEPLLGFRNILSIFEKLKQNNIEYTSSIITNGCLLSPNKVRILEDMHFKRIQISMDVVFNTHDQRRCFKKGKDSFDIIVKNIDNILDSTSINLVVQITADKDNISAYQDALSYFSNKFPLYIGKQLNVGYNLVKDKTDFDNKQICLNHDEEQKYREQIDDLHLKYKETRYPFSKSMPCLYKSENSSVIDTECYIYKCLEQIGDKEKAIGNLLNNKVSLSLISNCFYEDYPFDDNECLNCNIFPIYGGGCSLDRLKDKNIGFKKNSCSFYKSRIEEMLSYLYTVNEKSLCISCYQ